MILQIANFHRNFSRMSFKHVPFLLDILVKLLTYREDDVSLNLGLDWILVLFFHFYDQNSDFNFYLNADLLAKNVFSKAKKSDRGICCDC